MLHQPPPGETGCLHLHQQIQGAVTSFSIHEGTPEVIPGIRAACATSLVEPPVSWMKTCGWKVWCHKATLVMRLLWSMCREHPNTSWPLAPQLVLSPSLSSWLQFLADLLWHSPSWNPFCPCRPSLHHQKPWCILKSARKKYYSKENFKTHEVVNSQPLCYQGTGGVLPVLGMAKGKRNKS